MAESYVVFDRAALDKLFNSPDGPTGKELARVAQQITTSAKRNASGRPGPRVITGRLRSSIDWEVGRLGAVLVARIGTNVHYAPYVELGTSRAPAYPFLRPALRKVGGP